MSKRFWAFCLLGSFLFVSAWKLYSGSPWDLKHLLSNLVVVLLLWVIAGNVFKRIYEIDRGIPPSYKD